MAGLTVVIGVGTAGEYSLAEPIGRDMVGTLTGPDGGEPFGGLALIAADS